MTELVVSVIFGNFSTFPSCSNFVVHFLFLELRQKLKRYVKYFYSSFQTEIHKKKFITWTNWMHSPLYNSFLWLFFWLYSFWVCSQKKFPQKRFLYKLQILERGNWRQNYFRIFATFLIFVGLLVEINYARAETASSRQNEILLWKI